MFFSLFFFVKRSRRALTFEGVCLLDDVSLLYRKSSFSPRHVLRWSIISSTVAFQSIIGLETIYLGHFDDANCSGNNYW